MAPFRIAFIFYLLMSKLSTLTEVNNVEDVIDGKVPLGILSAKERMLSIQKKYNKYHNKLAPVNVVREFFVGMHALYDGTENKIVVVKEDGKLIEQFTIKHEDSIVALTIKTYLPTSVIGCDTVQNHTIVQVNQSIEKAKRYFGVDLMILVRSLCLGLVSSATDHRLDCWVEDDEFSFRFCVPSAKLNIEVLVLK